MDLQTRPTADQGQSTRVYGRKDISLSTWMSVTGVGHGQQHSKDVTNVQKLSPISSLRCHLHNVIYSSRFHLCSITYAKRILIRIHYVTQSMCQEKFDADVYLKFSGSQVLGSDNAPVRGLICPYLIFQIFSSLSTSSDRSRFYTQQCPPNSDG